MTGAEMIAAERATHPERGYDAAHDAAHDNAELARAAAAYLIDYLWRQIPDVLTEMNLSMGYYTVKRIWPWGIGGFKPTSLVPSHQLAKIGALVAAEIDRITAADAAEGSNHE